MPILDIKDLTIKFDKLVLSNFFLSASAGERIVIIGPSGCGKSSIFKAILGQIEYRGQILCEQEIGYLPQSLGLIEHLTVRENIELPLKIKGKTYDISDDMYQRFGIGDFKDKYIHQLSGGQGQRVALMRALIGKEQILLFDEPLSKVDQINKLSLVNYFLENITKEHLLIYITHDLYEAVALGTKIIILGQKIQIIQNNLPKSEMIETLTNALINS